MRILAIETASEACSVALFEGGEIIAHDHSLIGRGHAEALVPAIAALPDRGRAKRIIVSLGPGSFTGVRIGLAAARALGFAWQAEVLGYPTLALIAAMARAHCGEQPVSVCVNGGHGEWFVQSFAATGIAENEAASLTPQAASGQSHHRLLAGNRAAELAAHVPQPGHEVAVLVPDAAATLLLPPAVLQSQLTPIYGRAPDATPQALAVPSGDQA